MFSSVLKVVKNVLRKIHKPTFKFAEKYLGVHITPVHFYSPIPNVSELNSAIYTHVNECIGLDLSVDNQIKYLNDNLSKYIGEYTPPVNSGLSQVDAFILYALIRNKKPSVFIEIGSGDSTKISLSAFDKNEKEGVTCEFTAIEPFPQKYLKDIKNNKFKLTEKKVQDVDVDFFSQADILFIDSSHVAKIGSDVNYEILDIVPRLKIGSLVHWHDIMIPLNYHKTWIESGNMFWNESYMVHAFMLHNKSFKIIWASKYMQLNSPEPLLKTFTYFKPEDPAQQLSSFWIERIS